MLVVCPECKNEVSQYAESCPNCGFPITKFMKDNKLMDTSKMEVCPKCAHDEYSSPYYLKCKYCESTMIQTDFSEEEYIKKWCEAIKNGDEPFEIQCAKKFGNNQFSEEMYNARIEHSRSNTHASKQKKEETNIPKCPTCGSTKIRKISGTKRTASILSFGILSNNIGKTYECLNCKYKW